MTSLKDVERKVTLFHAKEIKGEELSYDELWGVACDLYNVSKDKSCNPKDIYNVAEKLVRYGEMNAGGTKEEENLFASSMLAVYAEIGNSGGFNVSEAKKMLISRKKLCGMLSSERDKAYAYGVVGLEDKDVAERYVAYTDKLYEGIGQNGYYGNAIVENCKKIVSRHPELAEKCNQLVGKVVDLNSDDDNIIGTAQEYCNIVIRRSNNLVAKEEAKKMKEKCEKMDDGYQYERGYGIGMGM